LDTEKAPEPDAPSPCPMSENTLPESVFRDYTATFVPMESKLRTYNSKLRYRFIKKRDVYPCTT
ncbi:MAG: hypothetical protein LC655_02960, partial [Bacteroidales bacterium]|nr:hypothetical protein [Bacteroidales bacterium]